MADAGNDRIVAEREGRVLRITINRPEVKNAVSVADRMEILGHLERASDDLAIGAVLLTGAGGSFCSGADLRGSRPDVPRPEGAPDVVQGEVGRGIRVGAQRLIAGIMDCEKPVIAAVDGVAAGMGAHIAFACDLVLASDRVRFIEVFIRRGLVPDAGGAYLLSRMLGPHKAKELFFFGDDVHAADAQALGLVNRIVPADELQSTAMAWAQRLAASPTRTLALTKSLVNRSLDGDRTASFHDEAMAQDANMVSTHDGPEGVNAFIERRTPDYKGW